MPAEIVKMKAKGFICVNSHPEGCRLNVQRQIGVARASGPRAGFKNVLVVGASTGYGLASRIAAAWGFGARTLGVFFERPPEGGKPATAGYYNSVALHEAARRDGLWAASINGDAFSDDIKKQSVEIIRRDMGPIDLVVYSLASPRRTHPKTGVVHTSSLKPIGAPFSAHTIDLSAEKVVEVTIPPASEEEIAGAVAVMGGEDWRMWIHLLLEEKLLAPGARTVAYSYIGPSVTWPIYRDGTMGRAKQDLEAAAAAMHERLPNLLGEGADAWVAVNKAVVTQASAAIPVVPLYMSLLPRVMKAKGLEEGCIEQMTRLLCTQIAPGITPSTDSARRIRMDDREMRADVQEEVLAVFPNVTTESLHGSTDFPSFKREFQGLFGFNVEGVDYAQPVETDLALVNP
jgi:enoyl-[acyl-carrier protein] reductase/trans-2-enoyl-CoA reductase (NAD+)